MTEIDELAAAPELRRLIGPARGVLAVKRRRFEVYPCGLFMHSRLAAMQLGRVKVEPTLSATIRRSAGPGR